MKYFCANRCNTIAHMQETRPKISIKTKWIAANLPHKWKQNLGMHLNTLGKEFELIFGNKCPKQKQKVVDWGSKMNKRIKL